jgi:hypothetical protein
LETYRLEKEFVCHLCNWTSILFIMYYRSEKWFSLVI